MLDRICAELRNYFLRNGYADIHMGDYSIAEGSIGTLPFLTAGQYFRIVGSALNDGVYQYPATGLIDEDFSGEVWAMSVPKDVVALDAEITAWLAENGSALASPYQSESFGGYSYSKKAPASAVNGGGYSWQDEFAARLKPYRRIFAV